MFSHLLVQQSLVFIPLLGPIFTGILPRFGPVFTGVLARDWSSFFLQIQYLSSVYLPVLSTDPIPVFSFPPHLCILLYGPHWDCSQPRVNEFMNLTAKTESYDIEKESICNMDWSHHCWYPICLMKIHLIFTVEIICLMEFSCVKVNTHIILGGK